jgi:hypothetical protein
LSTLHSVVLTGPLVFHVNQAEVSVVEVDGALVMFTETGL